MATFLGLLSHFVFLLAYSSVSSGRIKGKEGLNFLGKEDSRNDDVPNHVSSQYPHCRRCSFDVGNVS